jgi:Protein of unknown function (DUF3592)
MNSWMFYLILAAIPGVIVFAVVAKYLEILQVRRWSSAPGRIVVSTSQAREVSRGDANSNDTELRSFAGIEYEYTVAGRTYRGTRVSIGEDMGNFEVAETIARYPVGKAVTVYYNPNKREQAMLERDLPPGIFKAVIIFTVALVALVVGAVVGFGKLSTLVTSLVPNTSNGPFVAACLGFAALASLFIYAIQRNAALQRTWPTTTGRVESSGVHAFESRDNDDGRLRTKYRADVVYSYEVAGVRYTRDKLGSSETSSNIEKFARRIADRYPAGSTIEIHYNPANPAEAIVKPGGRTLLLLWLLPLAMVILAYIAAQ